MILTIPASVYISFTLNGIGTYFALFYAFGFLPIVELFLKPNFSNYSDEKSSQLNNDRYFDFLLYLMVPIQLVLFYLFILQVQMRSGVELLGVILAFGLACGTLGINCAHELGHRHKSYEKFMAKLLLLSSLYMHFYIEHNRGHHKYVSTPRDPASSRQGESLYLFFPRSIISGWLSAWKIDPFQMRVIVAIQLVFLVVLYFFYDLKTLGSFIASASFGILLLETVNYIEHYGLQRNVNPSGKYEKVQVTHSWNSNHPIGRMVLFELSRHSDHHANVNKKYQILNHYDESPQMPTGYPGMMLLSTIPPLWFKVMNRRIKKSVT